MRYGDPLNEEGDEQYLVENANQRFDIIKEAVMAYTPPGSFRLGSFGLVDSHMPKLIELLNQYPTIENLWLSHNNIGNHGITLLAKGLKYIKKLSLDGTNIGDKPETTATTIIALATSNIKHLILTRTALTNEDVDLLITHSRQTKLDLGNNWGVDRSRRENADLKTNENSTKLLEKTFLGGSPSKRRKKESDSEETSTRNSPGNDTLGMK